MKKFKLFVLLLVAALSVSLIACDDDDDDYSAFNSLPKDIRDAFSDKYPEGRFYGWEMARGYYVLKFRDEGLYSEGWFASGKWYMTETDLNFRMLPTAVTDAFKSSVYSKWYIDDIDMLERADMPTLYVIEAEKGRMEAGLYYFEDGRLLKEVTDDENAAYIPQIPDKIAYVLKEKYPGYILHDISYRRGIYEADIMSENREMEVYFDRSYKWISTRWDVTQSEFSDAILNYLVNNYPDYEVDDAEAVLTSDDIVYFEIELQKGSSEVVIKIKPDGELVK